MFAKMSISQKYKLLKRRLGRTLIGRNPFDLAYYFCKGVGLEVGARNNPYPFGSRCKVFYADIGEESQIEDILKNGFRLGSYLDRKRFAKVDYVLTAPKYAFDKIKNSSFDFVYSDNVLEHTPNPIFALIEQLRVTKVGGFVYAVIPNKNFTFDKRRSSTALKVLVDKYLADTFDYEIDEALDVIRNTVDFPIVFSDSAAEIAYAQEMVSISDGSYHFHVFDVQNTLEMLNYISGLTGATVDYFSAPLGKHIHFALRKNTQF
jgi:SAM-dependent methyltransferase